MGIRTKEFTIPADSGNRDAGKTYLLTEMPPTRAEKWAARILNELLRAGIKVPDEAARGGLAGLASLGASALDGFGGFDMDRIEPLMDEMLECVQFKSSGGFLRKMDERAGDVEEVKTLLLLRREVLELHLGFSLADKLKALSAVMKGLNSPITAPMSPASSP